MDDADPPGAAGRLTAAARRTYRVIGLGGPEVDQRLHGLADPQPGPFPLSVHYRLAFPEVLVTVVARGNNDDAAQQGLERLDQEVRHRLGSAICGVGEDDLPAIIGRALSARGATVSTAESCTGGLIGELLTTVAGSSAYFLGGVISYANQVKTGVLGVRAETLASHGAVSQACVIEMAAGARRLLQTSYGVAVSGVAGPSGGSEDKPVGTVWLAVAAPSPSDNDDDGQAVTTRRVFWPGEREQVRRVAAYAALSLLREVLAQSAVRPL